MLDSPAAAAADGAVPAVAEPLPPHSIYRSIAGRAEVLAYYDAVLARLPFPVSLQEVPTAYGRTHLTIGGRVDGAPLLVLPGMNIPGPLMLEFFARQGRDRLLIAPDLIGHPGRSEDRLHSAREHGFGRWLAEVMDALGLKQAQILSGSFGSSMALDLCAIAPERVGRQALVVPAGLTPRIPYLDIGRRFAVSWMSYRFWPDRRRLPEVARPLTRSLSPVHMDYLDIAIRQTQFWRHRPAGPFRPGDLASYKGPVLLVTAGKDKLFPREQTRANALATLNVGEEIYLPDSAHMPEMTAMAGVQERVAAFLAVG